MQHPYLVVEQVCQSVADGGCCSRCDIDFILICWASAGALPTLRYPYSTDHILDNEIGVVGAGVILRRSLSAKEGEIKKPPAVDAAFTCPAFAWKFRANFSAINRTAESDLETPPTRCRASSGMSHSAPLLSAAIYHPGQKNQLQLICMAA